MQLLCEICGHPIYGQPMSVEVDGAVLRVCGHCSRLGSPTKPVAAPKVQTAPKPAKVVEQSLKEPNVELTEDFHRMIKQAREKLGLSQEELGRKINEKLSVIKLLESGKLKPDNMLAKKIEHFLKIQILVPVDTES